MAPDRRDGVYVNKDTTVLKMTPLYSLNNKAMATTLYKLDIQGIVYLVDPTTSDAYLYDLTNPTKIGHVIWANPKEKPTLELLSNWQEILKQKFDDGASL